MSARCLRGSGMYQRVTPEVLAQHPAARTLGLRRVHIQTVCATNVRHSSGSPASSANNVPSTTAFGFKDFTASASAYGQADAAQAARVRADETSPAMIAALLSNPTTAKHVVQGLSESARRRLTMMASQLEWETGEPAQQQASPTSSTDTQQPSSSLFGGSREALKPAERVNTVTRDNGRCSGTLKEKSDSPLDNTDVSAGEYKEWARQAVSRRATGGTGSSRDINWRVLLKIALQAGCPFIAFGTLDNSLMLLSGDLIDGMVGERLGLTIMASAAMGGIVSGTLGIQMHGLADRLVQRYGPSRPRLTPQEWRMAKTTRAIHWGGTLGLVCGLSLGMFPLLFRE